MLDIVIHKRAYMLLVHLYVYLSCVTLLSFYLTLGVGGRLWIVFVTNFGRFMTTGI